MKFIENLLFRTVPVWSFILIFIITMSMGLATALLTYQMEKIERKFPNIHKTLIFTLNQLLSVQSTFVQLINNTSLNNQVSQVDFPVGFYVPSSEHFDGFFLVSAYDIENEISSIFLYDLSTKKLIREWAPDKNELSELVKNKLTVKSVYNEVQNFRSQHPIITKSGGIIISSGEGVLLKLDENSNIEWFIDRHFHHAIEPGLTEDKFISQIIIDTELKLSNGKVISPLRNDGYVIFSDDGKIISEKSFGQILIDNGYEHLLLTSQWQKDRIHLNDAEYIFETDQHVMKGDIMLSSRHLSIVLLYRPSENRIIWIQQGPFLNQHDIDYLGNGMFSIFGNDNVNFPLNPRAYADFSSIYTYDMKTAKVKKVLKLDKASISINSQGRLKMLENSDIFVDDGIRAMILDKEGNLKLSYSHPAAENKAGAMHWTRYYSNLQGVK